MKGKIILCNSLRIPVISFLSVSRNWHKLLVELKYPSQNSKELFLLEADTNSYLDLSTD